MSYSKSNGQASQPLNGGSPGPGPTRPVVENLKLIDLEQIWAFKRMLYRHVHGDYAVMLRGVGEAGTPQEGKFRENLPLPLGVSVDDLMPAVLSAVQRWGQHDVATFTVPAVMHRSILDDKKGTEDRIALLTAVCIDLDQGRPADAVRHLTVRGFGKP